MENFKYLKKEKIDQLPKATGVYAFLARRSFSEGGFLYIGKATNIRERMKNHFSQPSYRDNLFINQVKKVGFIETGSEIEALLLESQLIKKYQPKYNIVWRDDKNYFYVGITKKELPRVFITHQTKIKNQKPSFHLWKRGGRRERSSLRPSKIKIIPISSRILDRVGTIQNSKFIGPFVDGSSLKQTLRILRKIFPYYTQKKHPTRSCQWCHLGLCPGPNPDKNAYQENIKNLIAVLKGKKQSVLKGIKKQMALASKNEDFEKAAKLRDQIRALEKIFSHAKIFFLLRTENSRTLPWQSSGVWKKTEKKLKKFLKIKTGAERIEAYDVSNIQGKLATGSMITFINGKPDKSQYRKFKIKGKFTPYRTKGSGAGPNDVAMLKEVLTRRFNHSEWPYPDLILIDGGKAQLNAALTALKPITYNLKPKLMALAKKENKLFIEGGEKPILLKTLPREIFNLILRLRDEAHRFARKYHLLLRKIDILG